MRAGTWSPTATSAPHGQLAARPTDRRPATRPTTPTSCRCASRRAPCCGHRIPHRRCRRRRRLRRTARTVRCSGRPVSLAMGMSGLLVSLTLNHRLHELAALADEYAHLLESIGDPILIVGLLNTVGHPKLVAGEIAEALRLAERVIELADGDTTKGSFFFESPLAWGITLRGLARCSLGDTGWREDLHAGLAMARAVGGITQSAVTTYGYAVPVLNRALRAGREHRSRHPVALENAERFGDNVSLAWARVARGTILTSLGDADQDAGFELLQKGREQARGHGDLLNATTADVATASTKQNRRYRRRHRDVPNGPRAFVRQR